MLDLDGRFCCTQREVRGGLRPALNGINVLSGREPDSGLHVRFGGVLQGTPPCNSGHFPRGQVSFQKPPDREKEEVTVTVLHRSEPATKARDPTPACRACLPRPQSKRMEI